MSDRFFLGQSARSVEESPAYQPISRVRMIVGEDSNGNLIVKEAGSTAGRTIEIENPWATQEMCNSVLAAIGGYSYKPFSADGAILNPAAEIGDAVSVNGVYSVLADIDTTFSPIMSARIGAREDSNIDHEYPYESSEQREFQRLMAETKTSFIVEEGKIAGILEKIGSDEEEDSLVYRITSVETTVNGIHAYTEKEIKDLSDTEIKNWADLNFTPDGISSKVNSYYDAKGTAKNYNDNLTKSGGTLDQRERVLKQSLSSEIVQTARSITATVASATDKYDLSDILSAFPSGITIIRRYGQPNTTLYPPSQYNGQAYLDIETGNWWTSNGTKWTKQGRLDTVTATLKSSIEQTDGRITIEVSKLEDAIGEANAQIQVNANAISAVVNGSTAPEWDTDGSDGDGHYYVGNIVCVSTYQDVDGEETLTGRNYYKCIDDHVPTASRKPGVGINWDLYWEDTNAPTVQTMIDASLEGLILSYEASNVPNSAKIVLSRNGVEISGNTITMSNVEAETVSANASIYSPNIYGGRFYNEDEDAYITIDEDLEFWSRGNTGRYPFFSVWDGGGYAELRFWGTPVFRYNAVNGSISFADALIVTMPDGTVFSDS